MFAKRIFAVVFVLCLGIIFVMGGCIFTPLTPTTYSITSTAGEGGQINPEGELAINEGENQTFTITPDEGYEIADVLVDDESVGAVATYTFTEIQQNHTIDASFVQQTQPSPCPGTSYTITATAGTGGSIQPVGIIKVIKGSNRTFTISPLGGYQIADVLVDSASVGAVPTYTFQNVQQNHTIQASFVLIPVNTYTLTMDVDPDVGGTSTDVTAAGPYTAGTVVNIAAVANAGYAFVNWTSVPVVTFDDANAVDTTFTMPAQNITVTANFEQIFELAMAVIGEGDTTPAVGTHTYPAGSVVDITAIPSGGCCSFTGWSGDVTGTVNPTNVSMDANKTVTANFAARIVYNLDTDNDYSSIQAAIDAAVDGETVVVCTGTYDENIVFDGRNITVRSADPSDSVIVATTIIDGQDLGSVVEFTGGDTSTLEGLTIQNGSATLHGGGIRIYNSSSPYILGNTITNNTAPNGGGIYINSSSPTITGNTISNNTATAYGGGFDMNDNTLTTPTITGNTISNNTAGSGGGGISMLSSYPIITGNAITNNTAGTFGGGIDVVPSSKLYPIDPRPTGWGDVGDTDYREKIPPDDSPIAGNTFSGNSHSGTDGVDVYFY